MIAAVADTTLGPAVCRLLETALNPDEGGGQSEAAAGPAPWAGRIAARIEGMEDPRELLTRLVTMGALTEEPLEEPPSDQATSLLLEALRDHSGRPHAAGNLLWQVITTMQHVPSTAGLAAIIDTLHQLPSELGTGVSQDEQMLDALEERLTGSGAENWAELAACTAWVRLLRCAQEPEEQHLPLVEQMVQSAFASPSEQLRARALRALAYYDRRQAAADLLETPVPSSPMLLEAQLEAGETVDPARLCSLADEADDGSRVRGWWLRLLAAEAQLAAGNMAAANELLREIVRDRRRGPTVTETPETKRFFGRAQAAAVRSHLAAGRGQIALRRLTDEESAWLPRWERLLLEGLGTWQVDGPRQARDRLHEALEANPLQNHLRSELAAVTACYDPAAADELFRAAPPVTADHAGARAVSLIAAGDEEAASAALEALSGGGRPPTRIAAPWLWTARLLHGWRLRSEMAERAGDWELMARCLEWVRKLQPDDSVAFARLSWARDRILQAEQASASAAERHERSIEQALDLLYQANVVGEALFYRALCARSRRPDHAVRDCLELLRQDDWLERSDEAAAPRLLRIGDCLLDFGLRDEARTAWELAAERGADDEGRLAWLDESEHGPASAEGSANAPTPGPQAVDEALEALRREPPDMQGLHQALERLQSAGRDLPPRIAASMPLIADDTPAPEALSEFMRAAGPQWSELCPRKPSALIHRIITEGEAESADDLLRQVASLDEQLLCAAPDGLVIGLMERSVELASEGRFDEADRVVDAADKMLEEIAGEAQR